MINCRGGDSTLGDMRGSITKGNHVLITMEFSNHEYEFGVKGQCQIYLESVYDI